MLDYDAGDFYNDAACLPFAEQLLPDRCTHHYNQMNLGMQRNPVAEILGKVVLLEVKSL